VTLYQQEPARCGTGQQTHRPPARQISTAPANKPHPPGKGKPCGPGTGPAAALFPPSSPATRSPRHGPSPTGTMAPCTGQDRDNGPLSRLRPPPPPPGLDQDHSLTPKEPHPRAIVPVALPGPQPDKPRQPANR